jgi:hypothetical protein
MPDIAMCAAGTCPKSATCRRHEDSGTVPYNRWQSWAAGVSPGDACPFYWPTDRSKTDESG